MATRYTYGMDEPSSMGRPPGIADFMQQRQQYEYGQQRQYELGQLQNMQMRNDLARQQALDEQKIETDLRRNRLGLNGLDAALADQDSILHERQYDSGQVDREGKPMYMTPDEMGIPPVQIEMGGLDGSAPKPLGLSPLNRMSGRQEIRPEFADAKAALRPKEAVSSNRMTTQEYIERLKAKQETDIATDTARTSNDLSLKLTDAELESIRVAANIEAKDLAADKPGVAEKYRQAVAAYVEGKGGGKKLDLGGGAPDEPAAAPSETPTVSVSAKTLKTLKEGKYVQNEDGSIDFVYNDGRKVPYKK